MIFLLTKAQRTRIKSSATVLFLSDDFSEYLKLKHLNLLFVETRERLNKKLTDTIPSFNSWVSDLGKSLGFSLSWFMTSLAGRNVYLTRIYTYFCYLLVLNDLLNDHKISADVDVTIICEDHELLVSVERLLKSREISFKSTKKFLAVSSFVRHFGYAVAKCIWHLYLLLSQYVAARLTRKMRQPISKFPTQKTVMIHSMIDDGCLGQDGVFNDRYFGILGNWLEKQNYRVLILPWIFQTRKTYREFFSWLRTSKSNFWFSEEELRLSDYFWALGQVIKTGFLFWRQEKYNFKELDVTSLVKREAWLNVSMFAYLRFFLYQKSLTRWLGKGGKIDVYIDICENMPPERIPLAVLKKISPQTLTIGYVHSLCVPEMLNFYVTSDEWREGFYPQRVVANGPFLRDILVRQGFPATQTYVGPAFRSRVHECMTFSVEHIQRQNQVLILFSMDFNVCLELFSAIFAIRDELIKLGLVVALKPHPMVQRERLMKELDLTELPPNWFWQEETLAETLKQTRLAIGIDTSAQFEVLGSAIPVISLKRKLGPSYSPFDYWAGEDTILQAVPAEKLAFKINEVVKITEKFQELSQKIKSAFGPKDAKHLESFLP